MINIYDAQGKTQFPEEGVTITYVQGFKPQIWNSINENFVSHFQYVWFLDDDMIFSKNYFPFEQFLFVVKETDAVISTPKIMRKNKNSSKHKGTFMKEDFIDHLFANVGLIEIDSFMFKTNAWIFFHEQILLKPTPKSAWGPDCFWCELFQKHEKNFGKNSCIVYLHHGLMHLNTKSLTSTKTYFTNANGNENGKAIDGYKDKLNQIYGHVNFNCESNIISYSGLI